MSDIAKTFTTMPNQEAFQSALKRTDVAFALGLVGILVVLILPLPRFLLDAFLALSLSFSVMALMTVLFIERPLGFSSFPTVLLVSTMLRLALNVASTRLILSHGHEGPSAAGEVIRAFGNFVMQGNFVIGLIVFAILVIVNFVVITKGSGRIAEVTARFSLDSMPGKQMAIDADLSAGIINEQEAKQRRKNLEDESNFFGAMDGAAKFVRGDAIAGLFITFINIVGGVIIGMAQNGLALAEASHTYTLLTVGDGLVTQIPALIISTAAGMLVSKSGVEGSAEKALFGQLGAYPAALGMCSFVMVTLAILPGMPMLPFLALAGASGIGAWKMSEEQDNLKRKEEQKINSEKTQEKKPDPVEEALKIDMIRLTLGYGLLSIVEGEEGKKLTDKIKSLRQQLASELGFVLPAVRIQDNLQLGSEEYAFYVKDVEVGRGEVRSGQLLVMDPTGKQVALAGEPVKEPTFGLDASWVRPNLRGQAEQKGYTVVDAQTVMMTHLTEVLKDSVSELLSYSRTQEMLDGLDPAHKKLLGDIVPSQISSASIHRVLQNLLSEKISIRDINSILEGIAEGVTFSQDIGAITEHVRSRLSRQICAVNGDGQGVLPILPLSPLWEQAFQESIVEQGDSRQLSMAPSKLQEFIERVREVYATHGMMEYPPALVTSPRIRPYVRAIVERFRPQTVVISQNEIHPKVRLNTYDHV